MTIADARYKEGDDDDDDEMILFAFRNSSSAQPSNKTWLDPDNFFLVTIIIHQLYSILKLINCGNELREVEVMWQG